MRRTEPLKRRQAKSRLYNSDDVERLRYLGCAGLRGVDLWSGRMEWDWVGLVCVGLDWARSGLGGVEWGWDGLGGVVESCWTA